MKYDKLKAYQNRYGVYRILFYHLKAYRNVAVRGKCRLDNHYQQHVQQSTFTYSSKFQVLLSFILRHISNILSIQIIMKIFLNYWTQMINSFSIFFIKTCSVIIVVKHFYKNKGMYIKQYLQTLLICANLIHKKVIIH